MQPILERGGESIWARVEEARDVLCAAFERTCDDEGYDALVIKSGPFEEPAWVKIESWIPVTGPSETSRGSAEVKILAREFHRHELVYTVELRGCNWSSTHEELHDVRPDHCAEIARFVLGRAPEPARSLARLRIGRWGTGKNKVDVLRRDWVGLAGELFMLALLPLMLVPGAGQQVRQLLRERLLRRPTVVLSSGKPNAEPRILHLVDSWQTVVTGLGRDAPLLHERLLALLRTPPMDGFESRVENIWYWGLDGKVEREQVVMTIRRALLFCQIYGYDEELYVGWDVHLNSGQWVEKTVATGISKKTGRRTQVNTVATGRQPLSKYDLVDLNCLAEWTHARIVQLVQRLMEERHIEQEVDFKIIRGDRSQVAGGADDDAAKTPGRQRGRLLSRTG